MENWFAEWFNSPYYHLLYQNRDEQEAERFIDALLEALQPPAGAKVLDLACGRGRHSIYLAERDLEVVGLDLAPESIQSANLSQKANLRFDVHDMRQPFPHGPYDYIFNLFTSFGYFESEAEHLITLSNIAQALKPGGYLLLDFLNAPKVVAQLVLAESKSVKNIDFRIRRCLANGRITKDIIFSTGRQKHHYTEQVWAFDLPAFQAFFKEVGLELRETWGNYALASYQANSSDRLILLAQKPV